VDGVLEQVWGEAPWRRLKLVVAVAGHAAVKPDDDVQVDEPALLVLADLDVTDAHQAPQPLLCHPGQPREDLRQVDRGSAPQL
jgi:hypothetical protein